MAQIDDLDKDRIAIQAAADKQIAQLAAERDMAVRANEGITNDLMQLLVQPLPNAPKSAPTTKD